MIELLPKLQQHFDSIQDRLGTFYEYGFQSEGWFKGELLILFHHLYRQGEIQALDREVRFGTKRVDLSVRINDVLHLIELKHWLIGKQRGTSYGPGFYFGDPTAVGIVKDVEKLRSIDLSSRRWLLLLLTANPGTENWEAGVKKFNTKFSPYLLKAWTRPRDFPSTYCLGLLEVSTHNSMPVKVTTPRYDPSLTQ